MIEKQSISSARVIGLTTLTMIAFGGNSLLARAALKHTHIDAASFTTIRLISGTVMLWLVTRKRGRARTGGGNWVSAFALFTYAAGFSFAYVSLPTATGALLLFGAVQATMIGHGFWMGERLQRMQLLGILFAAGGLVGLLLPGLSAPSLHGSILMLGAGQCRILVCGGAGCPGVWNRLQHLVQSNAEPERDYCCDSATECTRHRSLGYRCFPRRTDYSAFATSFCNYSWRSRCGNSQTCGLENYWHLTL